MPASGHMVANDQYLIRTLWSKQLKQLLLDDLYAIKFVRTLSDFPDGTLINIPSIGEATVFDFDEGQKVRYTRLDEGNFQFEFDKYQGSATSISEKLKQDSYYANELISAFLPREHRALMEAVEARILSRPNAGQTANDLNIINTAPHRWVGSGVTPGGKRTISIEDFAKAQMALTKAQVPLTNLVAVVDPSVAYTLMTQANLMNLLSPNAEWSSVIGSGLMTGFRFRFNIMGFDVYVSNYLPRNITETVNSIGVTSGVTNLFFSAASGDICPIIGGFKQMPTVYSEFNKDAQETEYLTIARYGFKLYRPENMVIVLTDTDILA